MAVLEVKGTLATPAGLPLSGLPLSGLTFGVYGFDAKLKTNTSMNEGHSTIGKNNRIPARAVGIFPECKRRHLGLPYF